MDRKATMTAAPDSAPALQPGDLKLAALHALIGRRITGVACGSDGAGTLKSQVFLFLDDGTCWESYSNAGDIELTKSLRQFTPREVEGSMRSHNMRVTAVRR